MPRRKNCRKISCYPNHWIFECEEGCGDIVISLDEYEVIRLIDLEKCTQEECAERIGVARTTVTAIYESARTKLALFLYNGGKLVVSGGSYELMTESIMKKRSGIMRVATTYDNETGMVFGHFGHTETFKVYDIDDGKIISSDIIPTNGSGHGALAGFLKAAGVDVLICGGIGVGAQLALDEADIEIFAGNSGSSDEAVEKFLKGELDQNAEANCDHHHHHHEHGENCSCGCHDHDHEHEHHHDHDHDCGCGHHHD